MHLLSLPFSGTACLFRYVKQERIDPDFFKREYEGWNQIVANESEGFHDLAARDRLIRHLIRSKLSFSECQFQRIVIIGMSRHLSGNLFAPDGRFSILVGDFPTKRHLAICLFHDSDWIIIPRTTDPLNRSKALTEHYRTMHSGVNRIENVTFYFTDNDSFLERSVLNHRLPADLISTIRSGEV